MFMKIPFVLSYDISYDKEMPHISKRLLEKENFKDIYNQLYKIINHVVRSGKTKIIINEILTKTERIMISKRLAIIVMIERGESAYAIEKMLKISPSTVTRMSYYYENGKYDKLIAEIKKEKSFWNQITKIIPPRVGRNRFKNFLQFD